VFRDLVLAAHAAIVTLRTVHVYAVVPVPYRRWDEGAHRLPEPGAHCLPAQSTEGRARRATDMGT
jgi:hypothetical protein